MSNEHPHRCQNCAAELDFAPGTTTLKCPYCGTVNEIAQASEAELSAAHHEQDYREALRQAADRSSHEEVAMVRCPGCSAVTDLPDNVEVEACPFCGTDIRRQDASTSTRIAPQALLPFGIDQATAGQAFRKWVKKLWFAPNKLKHMGNRHDHLKGIYLPHWTYDTHAITRYTGRRGINRTERYTDRDSKGNTVTRTRTVTDWYPASGTVENWFNDIVVPASQSLPAKYVEKLEPWDFENLVPPEDGYLAGFRTERYCVEIEDGFARAEAKMQPAIDQSIRRDIGGHRQQINTRQQTYGSLTFKHVLLPVWASAYRFNNKVYRFVVNARTAEVQGERPWSWWKITLAALAGSAIIGGLIYAYQHYNGG